MVPRYHRMTIGVVKEVIRKMTELRSMKGIALELNLTVPTLCRIFRRIEYKPDSLPVVLSIDEFRGNTSKGKFQCIITDPLHRKVVDILPSRDQSSLCDYFKQFDHRENVKYFVMDMCKSYFEIAKTYFKNATIVIDRFHYVRHCTWALENVRKRVQKQLSSQERLLFKRSRKLLLSHSKYLSDEDKLAVARMLQLSTDLADAYLLKEKMYEFFSSKNSQEAKQKLKEYYLFSNACNVPEFNRCTQTFVNWEKYILSSFDCPYSNAFTEGTNNKIKVLKRVGFGYRNFNRFRNRILHCCS